MKIRIQGNSIRIRLSKSEVDKLAAIGYIEEKTFFGKNAFGYCLQKERGAKTITATYDNDKITMFVPETFLSDWPGNNVVGFEANMPIGENESLYLLLEKDFKCLDNVTEDQSDNFENPNKTC
ncbi:DUF7009 family protein [Dyadobacter sp. CY356]|uniref:DUF7009 family protein n=1 Tax=Dyadobacter sp. CY356 TaxID=2906442 RepID=UPI001F45FA17|nr:hypothetical protein [Dyadobacter sp. CY356]MCF0054118.1 hypothetical protein [Dyadobacter sp. CY356]